MKNDAVTRTMFFLHASSPRRIAIFQFRTSVGHGYLAIFNSILMQCHGTNVQLANGNGDLFPTGLKVRLIPSVKPVRSSMTFAKKS